MSWTDCATCGALCIDSLKHRCPPAFEVCWPDAQSRWRTVHGYDVEDAARNYCDRFDAQEHENAILSNGEVVLAVRRDGKTVDVHVSAEMQPHYRAMEAVS